MSRLLSLMIVDDEPIIVQGLKTTYDWTSCGYQVTGTALDGIEALEHMRESCPDVLMTDIHMKQMNGLELVSCCRNLYPSMKYVIISAFQDFEYARTACNIGIFSYLLKPIGDEQLYDVMNRLYQVIIEQEEEKQRLHATYGLFVSQHQANGHSGLKFSEMIGYIHDHIADEDLSLSHVAQKFHYNAAYLGRLFKCLCKMPFRDYLSHIRIKRAVELMTGCPMSVLEVGEAVGIGNPSYFSTLFKAHTGYTPTDFRKIGSNEQP